MTHISCPGPIPSEPRACQWLPLLLWRRPISYCKGRHAETGTQAVYDDRKSKQRWPLWYSRITLLTGGWSCAGFFLWEESVRSIHPRVQVLFCNFHVAHLVFRPSVSMVALCGCGLALPQIQINPFAAYLRCMDRISRMPLLLALTFVSEFKPQNTTLELNVCSLL